MWFNATSFNSKWGYGLRPKNQHCDQYRNYLMVRCSIMWFYHLFIVHFGCHIAKKQHGNANCALKGAKMTKPQNVRCWF